MKLLKNKEKGKILKNSYRKKDYFQRSNLKNDSRFVTDILEAKKTRNAGRKLDNCHPKIVCLVKNVYSMIPCI